MSDLITYIVSVDVMLFPALVLYGHGLGEVPEGGGVGQVQYPRAVVRDHERQYLCHSNKRISNCWHIGTA